MVTVAPGIAALVASVTWPTIALVVSPCARVSAGNRKRQKAAKVNPQFAIRAMIRVSKFTLRKSGWAGEAQAFW
jgi:hypothetical protein